MTTLDDLARGMGLVLADWQRAVARMVGLDLDADLDQLAGYSGRRCGWYPHRPRRRPR